MLIQFQKGDLYDEDAILDWLTGMDGIEKADEIEDLNRKLLEKVIDESQNVAVLFCKFDENRVRGMQQ